MKHIWFECTVCNAFEGQLLTRWISGRIHSIRPTSDRIRSALTSPRPFCSRLRLPACWRPPFRGRVSNGRQPSESSEQHHDRE